MGSSHALLFVYVFAGHTSVLEQLEESQLTLQAMLSGRHIDPFRDTVLTLLATLSEVNETLDLWSKVQQVTNTHLPALLCTLSLLMACCESKGLDRVFVLSCLVVLPLCVAVVVVPGVGVCHGRHRASHARGGQEVHACGQGVGQADGRHGTGPPRRPSHQQRATEVRV